VSVFRATQTTLLLYISNFFSNCLGNLGVEFQHISPLKKGRKGQFVSSREVDTNGQVRINPRQPTFQFLHKAEDLSTEIGELVRAAGIKQHHFKLPISYNV